MLAKAPSLGADEVIVDLEDAVAAEDKEQARGLAVPRCGAGRSAERRRSASTHAPPRGGRTTCVRPRKRAPMSSYSPRSSPRRTCPPPPSYCRTAIGLEAQIETARGLVEAERIAAAGHGLEALVFGPADLAASLGVPVLTIGAGATDYALARVVAAARASGLQALDGPHARLGDDLGLVLSARRALEHGYDGKWVIHPSQIEPVNRIFTPSPADVERARRILEAATGAARFEGELVDEASRKLAESLLRRAELLS